MRKDYLVKADSLISVGMAKGVRRDEEENEGEW